MVDLDGRVVSGNAAFQTLFDWDPATHPILMAADIGDPREQSWPMAQLRAVCDDAAHPLSEHRRFRRLDGGHVLANLRTWASRAADGSVVGMVATFTPSASSGPDQYRLLWEAFEEQREMMVEWALDGTVLFCNRACRDFFGWNDNVVGRDIDELEQFGERLDRPKLVEKVLESLSVGRQQRVYPNGHVVDWADTPVRDVVGKVVSVFSMGQDITERLRIEEALRLSERRNRVMVANMQDAVLLLDERGRLIHASSMARPELGYGSSDQFIGGRLRDYVHPDDLEKVGELFGPSFATPGAETGWQEVRARKSDGDYAWLEVSANNLLHDPDVSAVVLTVRNIDQRKRLELELDERRLQAQEDLRQRLALVAQVGHELRNPLQGLAAFADHLAGQHVPSAIADDVDAIARLTRIMRRVVDDLLDASQLELGAISVRSDVVDVAPIIDDAVFMARQLALLGVEVEAAPVPAALRHVTGDGDRIRQALTNLLSNACKHTAEGSITVVAEEVQTGFVRLSVLDTGSGISADDVARIFRPFERGRDGVDPHTPGIGLGLSIVTGIAAALGGAAGAEPRAEGGSAFWIDVPLSAEVAPTTVAAGPRREVPRRHVLVVDDEPLNRLAAKFLLGDLGAEVASAVSGEQALQMLGDQRFDTVFADVNLPGISGLELTRQLRARGGRQPVVAIMTGDVSDASRAAATSAGADAFVAKPSSIDDLVNVLRRSPRA